MKYNPSIHHRRTIRLKGYDYSKQGLYFITICSKNYKHVLGEIAGSKLISSRYGKIVQEELLKLPKRFADISINNYVIMPNHIHLIIQMYCDNKNVLGNIIKTYKSVTTLRCNNIDKLKNVSIWRPQLF